MRMIDQLNDSNYHNQPHHNNPPEARPKSSHNNDKYQKSIEMYDKPSEMVKVEVRPGSSKSSRLFKKKSSIANDIIKGENE